MRHSDATSEWYVTQVWAGREQLCANHLRLRGYEVFLPCYRENRRWSDRVKKVERPLFPGYVFCRLTGDAVGNIVTTPSVIRIVGDGTRALPIPTQEIEAIQRVVALRLNVEPWQFLAVGQRVRIDAGPLRDMEGIVIQTKNRHRLIVSVSLLQRSVSVEIDSEWVSVPAAVLMRA